MACLPAADFTALLHAEKTRLAYVETVKLPENRGAVLVFQDNKPPVSAVVAYVTPDGEIVCMLVNVPVVEGPRPEERGG